MSRRRALAVGAALALTLAGCTAASAPEPTPAPTPELAGDLTVLAAASLTGVFEELAAEFGADHPGVTVTLSFGGSSALAEQIVSGAPADVFASANEPTMQSVVDAGLAADPSVFATNTLEIVVPAGNPGEVTTLADLARPELVVALCDPAVPCGSAAEKLLVAEGVAASVDTLEEDVRAVLTKVALGEVDAALVYRTDVLEAGSDVEGIEVPAAADIVNRYPIAALAGSGSPEAAAAFVAFVRSPRGAAVLAAAGFGAP